MEKRRVKLIPEEHRPVFSRRANSDGSFRLGRFLLCGLSILAGVALYAQGIRLTQEANDREIAKWVLRNNHALENPANLEPGERYYEEVIVVGAGRTLVEKWRMEAQGGLVDVRAGPGVYRKIIGTVQVGHIVQNVVIEDNWAFVECRNINGLMTTEPSKFTPKMCVINADNLLSSRQ